MGGTKVHARAPPAPPSMPLSVIAGTDLRRSSKKRVDPLSLTAGEVSSDSASLVVGLSSASPARTDRCYQRQWQPAGRMRNKKKGKIRECMKPRYRFPPSAPSPHRMYPRGAEKRAIPWHARGAARCSTDVGTFVPFCAVAAPSSPPSTPAAPPGTRGTRGTRGHCANRVMPPRGPVRPVPQGCPGCPALHKAPRGPDSFFSVFVLLLLTLSETTLCLASSPSFLPSVLSPSRRRRRSSQTRHNNTVRSVAWLVAALARAGRPGQPDRVFGPAPRRTTPRRFACTLITLALLRAPPALGTFTS